MDGYGKPLPRPTVATAPFWDGCRAGVLRLPWCRACGRPHFFPRTLCPHCLGPELEWRERRAAGACGATPPCGCRSGARRSTTACPTWSPSSSSRRACACSAISSGARRKRSPSERRSRSPSTRSPRRSRCRVPGVSMSPALPRSADIVIIGAGAIGASIAYQLGRRGARDVVVLERDTVGAGSTSKAAGGIRVQFATRVEIELSLRGIAFFKRFEDEMGVPCDFHQEGYLFVITDEPTLARFRDNVALQRSMGGDVRVIAPDDARALVPSLNVDDAIAAVWGPMDGHASPNDVVQAYAAQARARGVRIVEDTPVTGIVVERGRVTGVLHPGRHHRDAARGQRGRALGAAGRPDGRPRAAGGPAAAPHLRDRRLRRHPPSDAARHRHRQRLLLPERAGGHPDEPGRHRGHHRVRGAGGLGACWRWRSRRRCGASPRSRAPRCATRGPACGRSRRTAAPSSTGRPAWRGSTWRWASAATGSSIPPGSGETVAEMLLDGRSTLDIQDLRLGRFPRLDRAAAGR